MSTRVLQGDCRSVLRTLPDASVHCCVTSPPYWGLRSYLPNGHKDKQSEIGAEATPYEYVAALVEVFREVRRVLRDDGVLWINLGDCYTSGGRATYRSGASDNKGHLIQNDLPRPKQPDGLKPKDLVGIPWSVAFALRDDGWYLRSALPWLKRSCMPESVTDRPTMALEYVFLLTKGERYFWDAVAVAREGAIPAGTLAAKGGASRAAQKGVNARPPEYKEYSGTRNFRNSDLFFDSLESPHGLITDADGEPLALDVNTQPFSDWTQTSHRVRVARDALVDGKKRITSPDCPVHGDHRDQAANVLCGEHEVYQNGRSEHIDCHRAPDSSPDYAPIEPRPELTTEASTSGSPLQHNSSSAMRHSNQSRKMAHDPGTTQPYTACVQTADRTADTLKPSDLFSLDPDISGNNISGGDCSGNPDNQNDRHTVHTSAEQASFSASHAPECICEYYIEKTEKSSHFATFPPRLIEPLIKAGTSERGCCPHCGAPWARVIDREYIGDRTKDKGLAFPDGINRRIASSGGHPRGMHKQNGWQPTCSCPAHDPISTTVLDPFIGAGTTALVADRIGRDCVGIDLSADYGAMARNRVQSDAPLLAQVAAE